MIIDGHAHACGTYLNGKSIIGYLDSHGIDKVLLCAGEPESDKNYSYPMLSDTFKSTNLGYFFNKIICFATKMSGVANHIDEQNRFVYNLSMQYPERILNAYWVNPQDEDCLEKLNEFYKLYNFRIIKMHQCWNRFDICDEKSIDIIKWATEKNMPIFIHLLSEKQVFQFIKVANKFNNTTFIVAHMIGFEKINKNTKNSNIYYDLSAPQLYPMRIIKKAINEVSSTKLILGSDTPYGIDNINRIQKRLKQLSLPEKDLDNIMGNNLSNLLGLQI
ncbi:amidohydrolase family protein [Clostridium oceanicum]|uniref:Amidohydrolase-related domain-containing protein n=1 Tax=Clostridium oceanicum TaxID=1543 RepID=A0ABP3UUI2_9CLOT